MMFACLYSPRDSDRDGLVAIAREISPRYEAARGGALVTLDVSGLKRLFGDAAAIGRALCRSAAQRTLTVHVAVAPTQTAACLFARAGHPLTVTAPGAEAAALAPLPLALLRVRAQRASGKKMPPRAEDDEDDAEDRSHVAMLETLHRWGLRTLGELAALSAADLLARLGDPGVRWQRLARGEDPHPLVPTVADEPFEASLELEWPIEGLEPLSFVLGRLLEPLCGRLERRDRGGAALQVALRLTTRELHVRRLQLPVPLRDARVLRTLALLDLESHPPSAGIDVVSIVIETSPGPIVQYSLIERPTTAPEQLSTLLGRLTALMGEGRCGSPQLVDTHRPDGFVMGAFQPGQKRLRESFSAHEMDSRSLFSVLRRFRAPVSIRVSLEDARPARVIVDAAGGELTSGRVVHCAGPWRTSGDWFRTDPWSRETWDVALASGGVYRIYRDRRGEGWFVEGVID